MIVKNATELSYSVTMMLWLVTISTIYNNCVEFSYSVAIVGVIAIEFII